ncbi:YgfZ/GcvT domain-containing protein [Pseudonocardia xinjiangensis]|uniref:Folate-binding protein YgfZ n=1 Tax=Pseudonocardia xinjiangensis TaxID=75289 RepID=A0ABX1R9V3_9PSEU|nr:folate-binding protein YgfZ [Pseudonocardia xinjiangensis]NMH75956.1 folate-binding protein YgfZ [Pseudonocardia xinjiangensis]
MTSTDQTLPGADSDPQVPAHRGDPLAEQRAMARTAAVVDRGHRGVIAVTGEDRLSWLHLLLSQHVSELPSDTGTEALILDINGRVLHHMVVAHAQDTVYLDTEPGDVPELLGYLQKMVFWSKVEPRDATDELAVLSIVGPATADVLAKAGCAVPAAPHGALALPDGGVARRMTWPGTDAVDLLVPREAQAAWWERLTAAGARPAGTMAFEAMRVESLRPRLHVDTDDRTIPHEVGWIGSAVHLTKGCYRGQETVARVANLGRPPRRLVLLHLDGGDERLPLPGDPVLRDGRPVGRVGTVALHHELGPVALALLKRSVPVDAELVAGAEDRVAPAAVDPSSVPPEDDAPPPGRAAQMRGGLRG